MAVVSPVAEQATVPKKLTWRNNSGYAAGDAANNLVVDSYTESVCVRTVKVDSCG